MAVVGGTQLHITRWQDAFAGTWLTNKHQRFRFLNVAAFGELMNPRCRDLRGLTEVELLKRFTRGNLVRRAILDVNGTTVLRALNLP